MKLFSRIFLTLICISSLLTQGQAQHAKHVSHEIIVKLKSSPRTEPGQLTRLSMGSESLDDLLPKLQVSRAERLLPKSPDDSSLNRLVKLTLKKSADFEEALIALQGDANVEYAQPNYRRRLHSLPNDPLLSQQEALRVILAEEAWQVQVASPEIIVGVIDTGIDYHHEDLRDAIWLNAGEDLNGNGRVDSTDFNNIDDDGNGFVDDIRGWDFTDAPTFPDGGDFRVPDNDPMDDNGHGTSVAGIIGASGDNGLGIAGVAYGCQIMNLRAGTSLGFLEEDDVASAIVYAVENGAHIINMSFGDIVASPLLQDVVQYAYEQNCVLVTSAGNAATDQIHFPSGFAETISVGATTIDDNLASFSNFGTSVDLVAPGVNVMATKLDNQYGGFTGTSASAPIISGLAALILSKIPALPNESLKGLLLSASEDLGQTGWDNTFAAGRANALQAVTSPYYTFVRIITPRVDQGFSGGSIDVRATAAGAFLEAFTVEIGVGETPNTWSQIYRQEGRQAVDADLVSLGTGALEDTLHTLRLLALNKDGTAVEDKVRFFIDRTPPAISDIRQTPVLDGDQHGFLLEFDTDDLCNASLHFRPVNSMQSFQEVNLRFRTAQHRVIVNQETFRGQMEFYLEATNRAGLTSVADNNGVFFLADLDAPPIGGAPVDRLATYLPSGFLLSKVSDFDLDGRNEVILNRYDGNFNFGSLQILEFDQDQFTEVYSTQNILIPRDWGDSDGDGKPELLAGAGPRSQIIESTTANGFPSQIVWSDSNAWASRFSDLDQDGRAELVVRVDNVFEIRETTGDNEYLFTQSLPNPTPGMNDVGVPKSIVGDFDGDTQLEILLGDGDGDVYVYESRGDDNFVATWSDRLPLIDTIDHLSAGDYNGDGVVEFVVGCHTDPSLNTESSFDSRHWLYRIYESDGDDMYVPAWEQAFFGFQSPADFDAGVSSGDVDHDGRAEILIHVFPDVYIVDYDTVSADYKIIWHATPARSNSSIVADLDGDGFNEFYFNDGNEVRGQQFFANFTGPATPIGFQGQPLDESLVRLEWQYFDDFDEFQIFRGFSSDYMMPIATVTTSSFLDSNVVSDSDFWYSIAAINFDLSPSQSRLTPAIKITPGAKPFLQSAEFLSPNQVGLVFSEAMNSDVKNQTNFRIDAVITPSSAILHKSGQELILTSPVALGAGSHEVLVQNVSDLNGTPIDTMRNSAQFDVPEIASPPYLVSVTLFGENQLRLEFDQSMEPASAAQISNYSVEPNISVASATLLSENSRIVVLLIDPASPIGPFGVDYFVTVRNVMSQSGTPIKFGMGDAAALVFSSPDLAKIFAYPNPYRADSQQAHVTIAGLTREAVVRILDSNGRLLRTLHETDGNGGIEWDLKDDSGEMVASGIYLFYVVGEEKKGMGKLAVVR